MSTHEGGPEPEDPVERVKQFEEKELKEIEKTLERVDWIVHEVEEKARKMYKINPD